jgi:copper chaperone CopZ
VVGFTLKVRDERILWKIGEHVYRVTMIHCQNCIDTITTDLLRFPGVHNPKVSLEEQTIRFETNSGVSKERLRPFVPEKYTIEEIVDASRLGIIWKTYRPLALAFAIVILFAASGAFLIDRSLAGFMRFLMAGFFLFFGGLKALRPRQFADLFATYDIVARRSRLYALTYPFIEVGLGFLFLFNVWLGITDVITILIMSVGSVGIWQALQRRSGVKCACLGSFFSLPLSRVTLVENIVMVLMAVARLTHIVPH